jgi:hypothetical protein
VEVVGPACRLRRQHGVVPALVLPPPGDERHLHRLAQVAAGRVGHPPRQSVGQADALVEDGADLSRAAAAVAEAVALVLACPPRRLSLGQEGVLVEDVAAR